MKDKEELSNLTQIKEDLEKSKVFLDSIIDQSPFPTWISDLDGTMIRANQALRDALNLTDEQLIGKYNAYKDPQLSPDVLEVFRNALEKGITSDFTLIWSAEDTLDKNLKGGNTVNCEGTMFPIKDQNGTITNAVITYKDVTERKETEKRLRESEEQYRLLAENVQDNMWIIDLEGNTLYSSPSVEKMTGYTPAEVMSLSLNETLTPESYKKAMETIAEELENDAVPGVDPNRSRTLELEEYKKDGGTIWTETTASFLRDENGRPIKILGVTRDITERKKNDEQLQAERSFSDTIIQSMPGLFYIFEESSAQFFRRNNNWTKITGYSDDELNKMTALDFFPEGADRDLCASSMQKTYNNGSSSMENMLLTKDGRQIPYYFTGTILVINDKNYLVGMGIDITENKKAAEKLQESEEQFRQLSEATWEAIVIHKNGVVLEGNSQYFEMFGYTRDEVIGQECISKTSTPESEEFIRKQIEKGNKGPYLATGKRKDGSEFPMELRIRMMPYRDHMARVVAIRNITEQRRAEKELQESGEKFRSLFDSMDSGCAVYETLDGEEFTLVDYNRAAEEMDSLDKNDLIGRNINDLFPDPVSRLDANRIFKQVWNTGNPELVPLSFYKVENKDVWRRNYIYKLSTGEIVVVFTDETKRKQGEEREELLNKQLVRAERMEALGVLAGGVAHDLNNVLGPMVVLPEFIDEDIESVIRGNMEAKEQIDESLSIIKSSAERAAIVVRDLVALSRGGEYDRIPTDINSLPCVNGKGDDDTDIQLSHPKVSITYKLCKGKLMVTASGNHLCRVMQNLMRNAAEAIQGKGKITVTTSQKILKEDHKGYTVIPSGTYALIEVSDTGKGIATEHIDRIFEPFFTKKKKNEHSGSGLGLSVVHGVIGDHNGFIDVASELGNKTTFSIYLPIISDLRIATEEIEEESISRGTERILVVDDEPSQRFLARKSLEKLGYTVTEAEDGHEALELFEQAKKDAQASPFDLVVLDMIMEDRFDGLDTLNEILKLYPKQKVLIASGHAENDRSKATQELGASWLSKPYQMFDLARVARKKLDN